MVTSVRSYRTCVMSIYDNYNYVFVQMYLEAMYKVNAEFMFEGRPILPDIRCFVFMWSVEVILAF